MYVHILYPVMTRRVGSDYTSYVVSRRTVHQAIPGWRRLRTDTYPGGMMQSVFYCLSGHGSTCHLWSELVGMVDRVYIPPQNPVEVQFHQVFFRGSV